MFLLSLVFLLVGVVAGFVVAPKKMPIKAILKNPMVLLADTGQPRQSDLQDNQWSIGIYTGASPFDLHNPKDISNPVLSKKDVTGMDAAFVADPFLVTKNNHYFMFFEVLDRANEKGAIAYADSLDGKIWKYQKVVLEEPFHLSYPYVFQWDGTYYLIPESADDLSVRLYKSPSFPEQWEYMGNLISGYHWVDPSLVRFKNKWWLFVTTSPQSDHVNIYYADELLGPWTPHARNPVVKQNKHTSRGGGRIFFYEERLYRLTQDVYPRYGKQVFAFEISDLSETTYAETMVKNPIVTMSGTDWNAAGMHNVDPIFVNGQWLAAVDGRRR